MTPAQRLAAAGLRVTVQRVTVLETLPDGAHLNADRVARLVAERIGGISRQAVYDVLRALTAAGLLRRIEPAGASALYENRVADNHHHLVCRGCGSIADVDCAVAAAPCLQPSDTRGFTVDEAEIVHWGACPTCASTAASTHS